MHSDGRVRFSAVLTLLAALASPALSAEEPGSESGASEPPAAAGQATSKETSEQSTTAEPVEPFVPSESISADSAVAFPVDI